MARVIEMHFICHNWLHVEYLGKGIFTSGYWKIDEKHLNQNDLAKGIKFALHESKDKLSYLQGDIVEYKKHKCEDKIRLIVTFKSTNTPMDWEGGSAGEKGYLWYDDYSIYLIKDDDEIT